MSVSPASAFPINSSINCWAAIMALWPATTCTLE